MPLQEEEEEEGEEVLSCGMNAAYPSLSRDDHRNCAPSLRLHNLGEGLECS
jgi:hypothetical protein